MATNRRSPEEDAAERTLPHDLEAERAVIGAVVLHNEHYLKAARYITEGDFFRDAHRRIWSALVATLEKPNSTVDLIILKDALIRAGDLEEVGGISYLSSMVDGVPRSTNVANYARVVREKARLRRLIHLGNKLVSDAYDAEEDADTIVKRADAQILAMRHGDRGGSVNVATTSHELTTWIDDRYAHQGQLTGVDTGSAALNEITYGWQRGELIIVAARPSMGKTASVLDMAIAATSAGHHVALFSLEMKRLALQQRMLTNRSGVPLSAIQSGFLFEQHWGPLAKAVEELARLNIHIDDTSNRTVADIRGECRRLDAEHGLALVIVDYVQLVAPSSDKGNRTEQVAGISRGLKLLADELNMPVIVLSQLSRASSHRADQRPQLSDLRESGALEQDADTVCFIHAEDHRCSGTREFIFDKQRNGATGTVNRRFDRDTQRFSDGGEPIRERETPQRVSTKKSRPAFVAFDYRSRQGED